MIRQIKNRLNLRFGLLMAWIASRWLFGADYVVVSAQIVEKWRLYHMELNRLEKKSARNESRVLLFSSLLDEQQKTIMKYQSRLYSSSAAEQELLDCQRMNAVVGKEADKLRVLLHENDPERLKERILALEDKVRSHWKRIQEAEGFTEL